MIFFKKNYYILYNKIKLIKLKVSIKFVFYIIFLLSSNELISAEIVNFRFGSNLDLKRIVLDLSEDVTFNNKVFKEKIEINFDKKISLKKQPRKNNSLNNVIINQSSRKLTLNFKHIIHNTNIYLLKKKKNKYSRIVIDYSKNTQKKRIIVIDPGHGGKDSGAVGVRKKLEKNITLAVGLLLKKKIENNSDFKVVLTRKKDIFLKLRDRTKIAKNYNADIFISLHADYNRNKRTRGISLYTLSENASDKEAAALARRENKADFLGNVDLSDETSEVTNILIDLTKRETLNQSSHLVNFLIKEFKNDMNLLQRTHRFAGFAVLKSLDIPSVLIEMGYLSNLKDSKLLNDKNYHNKICDDILKAIKKYFTWKDKNTI